MAALRSSRMLARTMVSARVATMTASPAPVCMAAPRAFSSTPFASSSPPKDAKSGEKEKDMTPYTIDSSPQFPAPTDPFHPEPAGNPKKEYSETTKSLVRNVAKVMGYHSKETTAIRETSRMMRGVVEAVEAQRSFWYDECALPPTYQSFFQLHLLYVLILVTRMRALRSSNPSPGPVPEPMNAGKPLDPASQVHQTTDRPLSLAKAAHESYPTELLSHFFELAESQMRMVLGRGERERVIKKYMEEMGEQWKGAGTGLDYVLGLSMSPDAAEVERADAELASWLWRNLFSSRGLSPTPVPEAIDELKFVDQLGDVVTWFRHEMYRLDNISDEDVLNGDIGPWSPITRQ